MLILCELFRFVSMQILRFLLFQVGQNAGYVINRTVVLQDPDCISEGHIYHELLHALGIYPIISFRSILSVFSLKVFFTNNLDPIVTVTFSLIMPISNQVRTFLFPSQILNSFFLNKGMAGNFQKYNSSTVNTQNTTYDYVSVMHYDEYAFSSNGLPTIVPLQSNVQIGQRYNMSTLDIYKVRLYYNCSANGAKFSPSSTTTQKTTTYSMKKTSQTTTKDAPGFGKNSTDTVYEIFLAIF